MSKPVRTGSGLALLKFSLLFSSVDGMVASALMVPLLGAIMKEFPNASPELLNQTISLPSLLMIPTILITGYLSKLISKKYLLISGSIIFVLSGFGSMNSPNLEALVAFRAFEGIGMGVVFPLAPAMIAHLFQGEERAKMMGWANATGGIFSFFLGIGAGYVALFNWRYAFYFYLIFVIVVIMQGIFLPAFPPEKKDQSIVQATSASTDKIRMGLPVYLTAGAMLILMTVAMVILYNLAIFVTKEGIGNSAEIGLATSFNTVASIAMCFAFGYTIRIFKRYLSVVGLVLFACSYFTFSLAHNMIMVYVGMSLIGASLGCLFPYLMTRVAQVAPKAVKTMAVTVLSLAIYLGQFFSGYFTPWLGALSGSMRQLFTNVGIIFVIFAMFAIVYIILTQKNEIKILIGDEILTDA